MSEFTKDPSTHPANGPLTEERLIRVRDELAAAAKRSDGGNLGYMMADAAKAIDEVLAVRKAGQEPVIEVSKGDALSEIFAPGTKLYAAPQLPQPAVPDEAEMPGGPGVPEYNVGWANGWNSCREEMLQGAEPVRKPLVFFDGDISPEDAEKIIARIREMNSKPGSQQVMIAEPVSQPYTLRDGWVAVPVEMTPEQMRAVQRDSSLGTFASAHLSGAYDMYREFWNVAIAAAPQQEVK